MLLVWLCLPVVSLLPPCTSASTSLSLSFFFHSSAHPRDLHSFPTRRSSDLKCCPTPSSASRWRTARKCSPMPRARCASTDRKSTRLNSSHQIISYAVFCLKKKKTQTEKRYAQYNINKQDHRTEHPHSRPTGT